MQIKNIESNEIYNFIDIFPLTSNPSSEWLMERGYEFYTPPTPEPIVYVPQTISMRQCQLYLYAMDNGIILDNINNYILTLSKPAQIEWNTSAEVWRSSPMVESMRLMFNWDIEQMDNMFIDAFKL